MTIDEMEEALNDLFPNGYVLEEDNHGQIVIYTGLCQDDDGELLPFDSEEADDLDPDLAPLDEGDFED